LDVTGAREQLAQLSRSPFVGESPQLVRIEDVLAEFEASEDAEERTRLRVRAQSLAESLNILASFMTRTRRVQVEELRAITLPFDDTKTPSNSELRIAQAQLVGWLEGLFHGIQTVLFAQQMAARTQLEQMRRALPSGPPVPPEGRPGGPGSGTGQYL
jgi:hypothetical protein